MNKEVMIKTTIYNTITLNKKTVKDKVPKIKTTIFIGEKNDEGLVVETSFEEMLDELINFYKEEKEDVLMTLNQMKKLIEKKLNS